MYFAGNMNFITYNLCTMRPSGLGEFPVTSLSETELFEKFAVPQADILVQRQNLSLRNIQTFSGVNLDLSGIIRSLDFLLLFGQAKSRRKMYKSLFTADRRLKLGIAVLYCYSIFCRTHPEINSYYVQPLGRFACLVN
jgi:hypothetical protein